MDYSNIDPFLPLVDLHRHLDGSLRLETILDLGRQHNLPLPAQDVEGLRPYVQVSGPQPGVMAFISKFEWMTKVLVDYDACRRVAYENVEDARNEGLDYVELRFSPWFMAEANHLDPGGVTEAVIDGVGSGKQDFGIGVGLIGILSRTYGPEIAWKELQALLPFGEALVALDLAGDEAHYPGQWYEEHFRTARDAGWLVTVHAGEAAGPESIWQAVRELGARRIGHGVAARHDPALMEYLAEHRVAVEGNLTSNVQTMTTASYAEHPLRLFLEQGILATLNTDDPGISAIDLPYEYNVAAPAAGFTPAQIHQMQRNGVEAAFLTDRARADLYERKKI